MSKILKHLNFKLLFDYSGEDLYHELINFHDWATVYCLVNPYRIDHAIYLVVIK